MIGIYKITNIVNQKCYIGKSVDLGRRLKTHIKELKGHNHPNEHLNNAYMKYGSNSFTIEIIEECSEEELNDREIYWINKYKSYDPNYGYNKTYGGDGGNGYYDLLSDEEKLKHNIKQSLILSKEGNPNYGKLCYTDGYEIKYISLDEEQEYINDGWYKGVPDYVREKESLSNIGERNGFYGKKHTKETKKRLSDLRKGDNNWNYGKHIYHKGDSYKYVDDSEIDIFISDGWEKGLPQFIKDKISKANSGKKRNTHSISAIKYLYNNKIYYGWRELRADLISEGYEKISQGTINKLSKGVNVKGYQKLLNKIQII